MRSDRRVWQNKSSGDLIIVAPYWDTIGEVPHVGLSIVKDLWKDDPMIRAWIAEKESALIKETKCMLTYQAGWLFQNCHDVFFVMGLQAANSFEDLGEL